MKVLVACEFSGIVRNAFIALGHNAISCDLLESELPGPHIIGNILDHINNSYDLMIAHPPCTYLCNSGYRWLVDKEHNIDKDRYSLMEEGANFFLSLLNAPIKKIAIENPIHHMLARDIIDKKYTQIIQPWQFGNGFTKATCLWLKNLPKLIPSKISMLRVAGCHNEPIGPDQWKNRSRTYEGIAKAMAEQWGGLNDISS